VTPEQLISQSLGGSQGTTHWKTERDDLGFEERWAAELRRLLALLANPEIQRDDHAESGDQTAASPCGLGCPLVIDSTS
jgi:hypothetical protein